MEVENVPVIPEVTPGATPEVTPESQAPVKVPQYELPDGSRVDAQGLSKAWKENFMPEFTRKSQELSAIKSKMVPKEEPKAPTTNPLDNPEWQPGNYGELSSAIEQKVWNQILESASAEERQAAERDAYIQREIEEVKSLDKDVDVNRVMAHAAKYGYSSLIPAHQNLKAMDDAVKLAEERILKNMQARSSAPVGAPAPSNGAVTFPPDVRTGLEKARWFLKNNQ